MTTLSIHWPDVASFLNMGGYALYVWGSLGATALAVSLELISLRTQRRTGGRR